MIFKKVAIGLALSLSVMAPIVVAAPSMAATVTYSIPTGLKTIDQTPSSVEIVWNAVPDAPKYRVQYSKSPDFSDPGYVRTLEKTATVDMRGLDANTTYYFRVRVIMVDGTGLSDYGPTITGKTLVTPPALPAISNTLSVATYNVHCANCDTDPAKSWNNRRDSVIANVKSRMPDVIGVQEASQGWITDDAGKQINLSQFEDFRNRLNSAGAPYEVTNANRNNCVNSFTPVNCVYADQGASFDAKIFYNKNTVTMLSQGSALLPSIPGDSNTRYMSWASFKQSSTGKSFFFVDTHLDPRSGTAEIGEEKRQQAEKIVQVIAEKNTAKLPVIITGDMNSSKWTLPNAPYDEFTKAGYIDPTGGTQSTSLASGYAVSEKTINGRFDSFNEFKSITGTSTSDNSRALGRHIDYIFTSKMRVASWEMVVNADANGVIQGPIPSDHNMIVAKVGLPDVAAPAPVTKTAITIKAESLNGSLGAATSGEIYGLRNGGGYQSFERGAIIWSPSTGAHTSTGAIRTTWIASGSENGVLGYPTTDEIGGLKNGGVYQNYERGAIVWSLNTGAQVSSAGGIRTTWTASGSENGVLGYPTSNEIGGLKDGGVYQMFENGAIVWSPTTGAFISTGGIRTIWGSTGFENGRLGYPTSNEYAVSPSGSFAQNFQGGTITWTPTGSSIWYK